MGMTRSWEYTMSDTVLQVRSDRQKHAPYGLHGGQEPRLGTISVKKNGEEKPMPSKFLTDMGVGDTISVVWPGGGGWGDPSQRDPEMVLWDVIEGKVSLERAKAVYRVAITPDGTSIDWAETKQIRG